jgi:alpha-galactosidase
MKIKSFFLFLFLGTKTIFAQEINLNEPWKFKTGDDKTWASPELKDSSWATIDPLSVYEEQGFKDYNGYSWYRTHFLLPKRMVESNVLNEQLRLLLSPIDDVDQVFFNGVKIGQTGSFPEDKGGFVTAKTIDRKYLIPTNLPAIRWEQDNVLAIRVYDKDGNGGINNGDCRLTIAKLSDYIYIDNQQDTWNMSRADTMSKKFILKSTYGKDLRATIQFSYPVNGKKYGQAYTLKFKPNETQTFIAKIPRMENTEIEIVLTEVKTFQSILLKDKTPAKKE